MTPDHFNAAYETMGGIFMFSNVYSLWRDKMVRGYNLWSAGFFTSWGLWNLYYYPHLEQLWSLGVGLVLSAAQISWLSLAIYYTRRRYSSSRP